MFDTHPDDATRHIELRQEIVRQGVNAARHPGDFSAMREKVGHLLIHMGERVSGHPRLAAPPATLPGQGMRLAR